MLNNGSLVPEDNRIHLLEIIGNGIVGGMEHYVLNLIRNLPADQFRVTCISPYQSSIVTSLRETGCSVYIYSLRDDPYWNAIHLAVELIRSQQVDLIHAHLPNAHILGGIAGNATRTPAVVTLHGMAINMLELEACRTLGTNLIVVCQGAYAHARSMGIPTERLFLIPNGVDLDRFSPAQDGTAFRKSIDVPPGAPLVGFVGRLSHEKGPDQFIQAAGHMRRMRADLHFAMVGEGPWEGPLLQMVRDMHLQDRLHMVGLATDLHQIYPAFDVVAQTSRSEGMPFALLEAMASARPVVAFNVGGVGELVDMGSTGYVVPPADTELLAYKVIELLARPEKLKKMGEAARQRAEREYNLAASVSRTAALFKRLVSSRADNIAVNNLLLQASSSPQ